jgi:hypothetical protein
LPSGASKTRRSGLRLALSRALFAHIRQGYNQTAN